MNGSLKLFKAHLYDLVKTTLENGVFELNLKNLVEKHLVYSSAFFEFLFKDETLNDSIVQNTMSCINIENQSLVATLLYSLTFKEFLDELNFKRELKFLQNSYGAATLVDRLNALLAYSLLSLKFLGKFHSIVPFNASISNVSQLLLLFEGMDSRTNPFKEGADGMTQDVQGTLKLLQGLVTGAIARGMKEEHRGKIAIFTKMIQDLAWQVIGAQEEGFRGTKTLLFSKLQVEESK
ncbi:hypothetical protein M9H77_12828 [Catharanthus roseus]|uniref:Uncharacterized protein n=1 Tax=Catharanthus roseus TaxID=4058 RepID=A0ACC0BIM3_CATRO|nr:hypothetical protein M9H77_12828 [Catharanthus roseus]